MCFSSKCKYEDELGFCQLSDADVVPKDAFCEEVTQCDSDRTN